jgi:hypothetical protein
VGSAAPDGQEIATDDAGGDAKGIPTCSACMGDATIERVTRVTVPRHHRPTASSCSPTPLPAEPAIKTEDAGGPYISNECTTHADCSTRPNGRCVNVTQCDPSTTTCGTHCVYEECSSDAECEAGSSCFCSDDTTYCSAGYSTSCPLQGDEGVCACGIANQCKKGNCRVDSDCGLGGYCSPAIDDCGYVLGYFCHTPADECVNDDDCTKLDAGPVGFLGCLPDPSANYSRWICTRPASCP